MKIIFLDIDGVLNSNASTNRAVRKDPRKQHEIRYDAPDPIYIRRLNTLIKKTGAKIVISSAWRSDCSILMFWRYFDLLGLRGDIIGKTRLMDARRGTEILCWLLEHKSWLEKRDTDSSWGREKAYPVESFVILDDDDDMEMLSNHLVLVEDGLQDKHVKLAIEKLNKPNLYQ